MCMLILYELFDSIYWRILNLKKACVKASLFFCCNNLLTVSVARVMIRLVNKKGGEEKSYGNKKC